MLIAESLTTSLLDLLKGLGVLATIIGFFVSVLFLTSFQCRRLAKTFPSNSAITGKTYHFRSAQFGLSGFRGLIDITVGEAGIRIEMFQVFALFHNPILIPWSEITAIERDGMLIRESTEIVVKPAHGDISFRLPLSAMKSIQSLREQTLAAATVVETSNS